MSPILAAVVALTVVVVSFGPAAAAPVNVARSAAPAVTASSENSATAQTAVKAVDGSISGYPTDPTKEWATLGGKAGSWLQLVWATPVTIDRVVLYDRPNSGDRVTAATLSFSNGTSVSVSSLKNNGSATTVTFPARTVTSLRFTVTSVSTSTRNVGLAEIEVWGTVAAPPTTTTTTTPSTTTTVAPSAAVNVARTAAPTVTASSQDVPEGSFAVRAVDGSILGYPADPTKEWSSAGQGAGAWLQLVWAAPVTIDRVVLYDRPNTVDQATGGTLSFSSGTSVTVPSLNNNGSATTVTFPARTVTSLRFTVTSVRAGTLNVGLAEIEVWGTVGTPPPPTTTTTTTSTTSPSTTTPPTTTTTPSTTTSPSTTTTPSTTTPPTAPVANAGPDQTVSPGATVQLNGTASSDANGDPLTYTWTQTAGPAVTLSTTNIATPTFPAPTTSATLTFSLTVDDGTTTSPPDTVTINVEDASLSVTDIGTSARWTASFPSSYAGTTVQLQVQTIRTTMTDTVPAAAWVTLASAPANASGVAAFTITDPFEVVHVYRALAGSAVTPDVTYAAPHATSSTGLATVYIDTNEGAAINSTETYQEGQITIASGDGCSAVAPTVMKVRGRGNYTWTLDKKPYNINLSGKLDLCGLGSGKKWALLANHYDRSLLRTSVGMYLGNQLTNLGWTPRSVPVDVYVNGVYQGSYTLIERVTIATNRVNIPELKNNQGGVNDSAPNVTGGYLLEWDFRRSGDHNVAVGPWGTRGWVAIDEPGDEADGSGITPAQVAYIDSFLNQADAALFGSGFTDDTTGWKKYIDAASAVDFYIVNELTKSLDSNMYSSVKMYKQRDPDGDPTNGDQGKLVMGPLWDLDTSMGDARYPGGQGDTTGWYLFEPSTDPGYYQRQSTTTWFNRLNQDPEFRQMVRDRWVQIYPALLASDAFLLQQQTRIAASAAENFRLWDITERLEVQQVIIGSWSGEVNHLRTWLQARIAWMNSQLR